MVSGPFYLRCAFQAGLLLNLFFGAARLTTPLNSIVTE